jgi:hypothetical protein
MGWEVWWEWGRAYGSSRRLICGTWLFCVLDEDTSTLYRGDVLSWANLEFTFDSIRGDVDVGLEVRFVLRTSSQENKVRGFQMNAEVGNVQVQWGSLLLQAVESPYIMAPPLWNP